MRGANTPERFVAVFREACGIVVVDDGLRFDAETVKAQRITEDADYQGVRVSFIGYLPNARIPIQIDLGFGDVVTPAPTDLPPTGNDGHIHDELAALESRDKSRCL